MATKYIAHASIGENGKVTGGAAGDQTTKEVCIRTWYSKPWGYVLRIKNEKVRKQFGNNMIDIANNNNVGYNQSSRNGLLTQAVKVNFNFTKITTKCNTDCSAMVTAAILGAIYTILGNTEYQKAYKVLYAGSNCRTTSTLRSALNSLGLIIAYSTSAYTGSTSKLVYGDILLKEGSHVVAYVDSGKKVSTSTTTTTKSNTKITVDGEWGQATTKLAQKVFGTTVDGIVSNQYKKYQSKNPGLLSTTFDWKTSPASGGSQLIKAIQKKVGVTQDGYIGDSTIKAMQKYLGTTQDGCVSKPSAMVKAFQTWLNKQ